MGNEMKPMIERFANGIQYSSSKDAHEMDYGVVEVPFGRVSQRMRNVLFDLIDTCLFFSRN
jgi:hypothetical protein